MSLYDQDARGAATRGGFVKVAKGESMQFRVFAVHRIREVDGPNGKYESAPHDVEVAWHKDARGMVTYPKGEDGAMLRWDPAAKNIDGLIKIADSLAKQYGDEGAILNHEVIVSVAEERNPSTKRDYNVYTYTLAGAGAAAPLPPRTSTPPAPPPPGAAGTVPTDAILGKVRAVLAAAMTIEAAELATRGVWAEVQASKAAAGATQLFNARKLQIARQNFGLAIDEASLNASWAALSPKFARDPASLEELKKLYALRQAAIAGNVPPAGDDPAGVEDDLPF